MGVQRESDLIFPFDVKGPTLDHFLATTDRPRIVRERRLWGIRLGKLRGAPGIDWDWQVTMPAKHDGWIKDLQTTKVRREKIQLMRKGGRATRKMTWKHPKKERHEQLDQAFSDKGTEATYSASGYYPPIEFPAKVEAVKTFRNDATFDSPTTLLQPLDISATVHDSFKYFVLYKPDKKGAIWVPVAKAEWFWKAKASKRGSRWRLTHKDAGVSAKGAPTFEFPIYESNVNENQWVEVDGGKLDEEIEEQDSSPDSCPEEQEEGRLMDLTGSWNTTVSGVVGKTTREVGMPSGQHFPKGALDEAERKHESPFLDEELFADADVGFAERHVLGLAVDRPASPYPFAVELLEPEAGIETDVRSTEYKRGQALTCEPGRFKENQLQVVCWRRRTTPGKRRIPEKLKLAILCRGRIRLPTQKLQWLLESYKNAGWVSRLKVDLLQQLPWVDVTIELFFNQRVGRVTTEKINAVFKEYLQRRQERHFKGCPFVLYDASPAVRKGSYERKLGVQFERFYRLAGVPLPQKMDERDQQRYWLLVYASFPREIKKLIGPEKKADVERPLAVRKSIKQWRKEADELFINYKRQVPGRLTVADAKELNRRITASYAKMYLSRPAIFKWAGMAAFASAEIGRGIQKAWQLGFGDWGLSATGTALVWVGGLAKTGESVGPILGKKLFWALSGGNRFVWWDIFWQHLAYREAGIAALKFVHDAGELSQPPLDAWQHIDTGLQKGDSAIIWKGSRELLKYEQEFVLQAQVYDRSRDIWSKISDDVPSPIPEHGVKFTDYVQGGDIGNFENRWKWIEESMLPSWMSIETNKPEKVRSLLLALT